MPGYHWTPEEIELIKEYYSKWGPAKLAAKLGRTESAVMGQHYRLVHGLYSEGAWTSDDITFLKENYLRLEHREIAEHLGKTRNAVRNKCSLMGLRKKTHDWMDEELERLEEYYAHETIDLDELEQIFGRNKTGICKKARQLGLTNQFRPKTLEHSKASSRAKKQWFKTHEHPRGYLGHSHSKETRRKISRCSKAAWQDPTSKLNSEELRQRKSDIMAERHRKGGMREAYSRGKQGKRADLDGLYVRSAWEANYARYLNWLMNIGDIKDWEYEPDTFEFHAIKRGTRFYTPDFKITNTDGSVEYHEIKGWMDQKSKTKLKRMAKYYPDVPLKVIDADSYKALEKDVSRFILFWE